MKHDSHGMGPKSPMEYVPVGIVPGQCVIWRCNEPTEDKYCTEHIRSAPKAGPGRKTGGRKPRRKS